MAKSPNESVLEAWNPKLRKVLGTVAAAGALETGYLSASKLGSFDLLCTSEDSCNSVLNSPYAYIPGTEVPLALAGLVAYSGVLFFALQPLFSDVEDEATNRVLLATLTTAMGVFSVFLMSILFGVLHQSCAYCVASAVFSIVLAKLSWLGGVVPKERIKQGIQWSSAAGLASLLAASVIFGATESVDARTNFAGGKLTTSTVALGGESPPTITATSSQEALDLASKLEKLDTRFFGAFWCSHCYDQKQALGKQAMAKIEYIECARDGKNERADLCKDRKVPGYPTWEIGGELYPGERPLSELSEIADKALAKVS